MSWRLFVCLEWFGKASLQIGPWIDIESDEAWGKNEPCPTCPRFHNPSLIQGMTWPILKLTFLFVIRKLQSNPSLGLPIARWIVPVGLKDLFVFLQRHFFNHPSPLKETVEGSFRFLNEEKNHLTPRLYTVCWMGAFISYQSNHPP